jgi:hypothetical protein
VVVVVAVVVIPYFARDLGSLPFAVQSTLIRVHIEQGRKKSHYRAQDRSIHAGEKQSRCAHPLLLTPASVACLADARRLSPCRAHLRSWL